MGQSISQQEVICASISWDLVLFSCSFASGLSNEKEGVFFSEYSIWHSLWISGIIGEIPMATARVAILVLGYAAICAGQDQPAAERYKPPPPAGCDSFTMQTIPQLGFQRKACYYGDQLLTGSAIFGAAFFAAIAQLRDEPKQWPQGADGFGRRIGTRYTQGMAKSTGSFLIGALNREDPRTHPPAIPGCDHTQHAQKSGLWPRTGSALLRVVWAHRDNCTDFIAFSHFAGALSSGFVGRAWTPDPHNTIGQAFMRSGTAFGGDIGASLFSEFQGDMFGLFGRMFGSGKAKKQ